MWPLPDLGAAASKLAVDKIGGIDNFRGMNRLTIEIEPEQHRQIKTLATFAGMTIKEFILSKTLVPSESGSTESPDTTARLLGSAKNAKRLRDAIKTPRKDYLVFETMEELKDALGI